MQCAVGTKTSDVNVGRIDPIKYWYLGQYSARCNNACFKERPGIVRSIQRGRTGRQVLPEKAEEIY